ncbi:MAG TPA: cell division protein SepF [Nitriliruptoraceae bacterium]|nr:cell division protein SepF [Nitriliruptoraceae bacterium]
MTMWRKTLEYLGLVEEAEEYDELPERSEYHDRDVRPAMHDTTGPIDVVRVDSPRAGDPSLRPVEDLTEPVAVDEARAAPGGQDGRRRRSGGGAGRAAPPDRRSAAPSDRRGAASSERRSSTGDAGNVRQLRPESQGLSGGLGRRVAIVAVADYESGAREVGQRYRQSVPVVFDLTDAPNDDRRRVLDFVAGVTYALHGEMVKVGSRSFLIVPQGGDVSDAEWDRLASLGYRT